MSNLAEIVSKFGTDDKNTGLGNGFNLIKWRE